MRPKFIIKKKTPTPPPPPPLEIEYWPPKNNCDKKISGWRTIHVALTDKSVNKYIWLNPAHVDTSWALAS